MFDGDILFLSFLISFAYRYIGFWKKNKKWSVGDFVLCGYGCHIFLFYIRSNICFEMYNTQNREKYSRGINLDVNIFPCNIYFIIIWRMSNLFGGQLHHTYYIYDVLCDW